MDLLQFIIPLVRLSRHTISLREAVVLLSCRDGATAVQLANIMGETHKMVWSRCATLRTKGFISRSDKNKQGETVYRPTALGMQIIESINPKKQ